MRNTVKKSLELLLAAVLCIAAFPVGAYAAEAEDMPQAAVNPQAYEEKTGYEEEEQVSDGALYANEMETYEEDGIQYYKIEVNSGEDTYFDISPDEDGVYTFYGMSDVDSYGWLRDTDMNDIAGDDGYEKEEEFKYTAFLKAGETYYCGVGMYDEDTTAMVTLAAKEVETQGSCGNNMQWTYDPYEETLYIEGSGEMEEHPWTEHLSELIRGVYVGDGIKDIGDEAFFACSNLEQVSLPESLSVIGWNAFGYCASLDEIEIPESVYEIGARAFYETPWLKKQGDFALVNDILIAYQGEKSVITIPENVWTIGTGAFWGNDTLTSVTIPYGLEFIDGYAFFDCTRLKSVTIPQSVAHIGGEAFSWYDEERDETKALSNLTISGYRGTEAQEFAQYYQIKFKELFEHATPAISKLENVNGGIKLTWGKVSGAAKYRVFVKNGSGWTKLTDTASTSYTWKGGKSGSKYTFTVRCISADGKSYTSGYNTTGKTITYVAAPALSKLENVNGGIKLTWGKVSGAAKYRVFVKNGSSWVRLTDTTSTSFTWNKAVSGKSYTFTVRCLSKDGKSYTSGYNTAGKSIKYIAAPVLTGAKSVSSGIQVTWKKSAGAAKYRIYRKIGSGSWQRVGDTTGVSFVDKTAKKGVKYTYTVRCITSNGKAYTSGFNTTGKTVKR